MYKTIEINGKLGSAISYPSNPKYTAYSRVANPSHDALQNKMEILTHHRNYPCF
ncbi:Uncharacterised protein [Staphylococcus piscifermentans]|uniref:Uncharacterized protein n=1 Tax=Staphylococcus piscifermentans TaxID=70258 RepID=A0A239U2B1_9STAP|nr:hypothetical protein [Staphylococcus piscifermentans]GEP84785.1 hypothetical protein SPI02_13700 [Staphylococcus piscifermentans]SNV04167.1 Uncharacterised protein [Staphylococcus piscifermentans]